MNLQVEMEQGAKVLIVRLKGELDHHTAEVVRSGMDEAISRGGVNHIVVNLNGLTFMDSSGLGVILGRYKQVSAKGGKMVLCEVSPSLSRLFEMSGLFKILAVKENERQAISSLEVVS